MEITLPRYFDLHVHFRQGSRLLSIVPWTSRYCAAALVMPNTTPPIRIASQLEHYRHEIIVAVGISSGLVINEFQPLMTFKILPEAMSGCPKFFFGSDSAPHAKEKKECSECCAGIFTAPVVLPLLVGLFAEHNALDRLSLFIHDSSGRFYRLTEKTPVQYLRLVKELMTVPHEINGIVPFMAGQTLPWSVVP